MIAQAESAGLDFDPDLTGTGRRNLALGDFRIGACSGDFGHFHRSRTRHLGPSLLLCLLNETLDAGQMREVMRQRKAPGFEVQAVKP